MDELIRPALAELRPYEPGKPIEEVQRELGLDRVVKLASKKNASAPAPANTLVTVAQEVDFVITGLGD